MSREMKLGIVAIVVLFLLLLLNSFSNQQAVIAELEEQKATLHQKAVTFNQLKSQWGAKKRKTKLLHKLDTIKAADSRYKKGKRITLVYKNLSAVMADKIAHAILNSDATLVEFTMTKKADLLEILVEVAP